MYGFPNVKFKLRVDSNTYFFPPVALRPKADRGLPIIEAYRPHATKQYSQQDSSGRVISSLQRPGTSILCLKPAIPGNEQPQNYALYRAVTGTGRQRNGQLQNQHQYIKITHTKITKNKEKHSSTIQLIAKSGTIMNKII
jgi:hypothetical protein